MSNLSKLGYAIALAHGDRNYGKRLRDYNFEYVRQRQVQLPNKVLFNDDKKATTLLEETPVKQVTVVKTMKGDKYSREYGFLMAYFQHYSGLSKTQAKKYINEVINDSE